MTYHVLLMYPDYLADQYGETYLYTGEHISSLEAREDAQRTASQLHGQRGDRWRSDRRGLLGVADCERRGGDLNSVQFMNGSPDRSRFHTNLEKIMYDNEYAALIAQAEEQYEDQLSLMELDFNEPTYSSDFQNAEYGEEHA